MPESILQLHEVAKSYPGPRGPVPVLSGVCLQVHAGEFVVLCGRSGSGKSTLLNLSAGIDTPDRGQIRLAGAPLHALREPAVTLLRRRHIGFVFQSFNLIPTLTVRENVCLPLELNGMRAQRREVDALLDRLGLAQRAAAWPEQLSGGEQQRVAVARALVHRPALILADEPTGNLDLDTGREVVRLLDAAARASGTALLMVTHSPEVIGQADRCLRMADGRLVE